jgi:hypothetical protein
MLLIYFYLACFVEFKMEFIDPTASWARYLGDKLIG